LLPGLGATAHSFDEIAPLLARHHRVVAITRRGTGYSSRPDSGYDTPRLARDVLAVMDALALDPVTLVGHSIAGDELTWLGGHHPQRFRSLVYLDAAYDRSGESSARSRLRELNAALPPEPPIPQQAFLNYEAATRMITERGHLRPPEGELMAFLQTDKPFVAGTPNLDARAQQAITAAIGPPDYSAVRIPALAIYAMGEPGEPLPPWYDANDAQLRADLAEISRLTRAQRLENIAAFRRGVVQGQVLEMPDTPHNLVFAKPREVVTAIEGFVESLPR
jgi:pimeloyl-ACP methyl ester carboxylesterase